MRIRSKTVFSLLGAGALVLGSLPLAPPAFAATFTVNTVPDAADLNPGDGRCDSSAAPGNQCTVRAAVQEANALAGADTITIPRGTFPLTIGPTGTSTAATGDLDISGTLTINGAGRDQTTIDANDLDRVFDVLGGANATIKNLTVRDGVAPTDEGGGCIRVAPGGTLTFSNAIAESCVADTNGGGIEVSGAATVSNSIIRDNVAGREGGGIQTAIGSTLHVNDTTIDNNESGNDGGGIETGASATIRNSRITNNTANSGGEGGGLQVEEAGNVTLDDVLISGNAATNDAGGGIEIRETGANVTLRNVTVRDNSSGIDGGGIHITLGTLTFTNGTVGPNNTTVGDGGGIGIEAGTTATLSSVRIFDNSATGEGGGIDNDGTLRLDDVRITGNTAGSGTGGGLDYTDDESTSSSSTTIVDNNPGNCDPTTPCPP